MLFISEDRDNDEPNLKELLAYYDDNKIDITLDIINIISTMIKIDERCLILVPYDNQLYNKENDDFIYIREFLLKTCDVRDIIYLPIGICNIDIKLCFLHFTKKRDEQFIISKNKITNIHQTHKINFYDYNYFNNTKQLLIDVPINKIKNNKYSFNYIDYIQENKIISKDFFNIKKINEIAIIQYGNKIDNNNKKGIYKIYGNKNKNDNDNDNDNENDNDNGNKKSINYNRDGFNIIITRYEVALTTEKIFLNNYGVSIKSKSELILNKYLGYYLYYNYKDINIKTLHLFEISIPSLEVQEEIIKYLDNINNTIKNLKNEIKELNNQSFYFMKKI
jgi:hypothetical protein